MFQVFDNDLGDIARESKIIDVFTNVNRQEQTLAIYAVDQNDGPVDFSVTIDVMMGIEDLRDVFQMIADKIQDHIDNAEGDE